MLSLLKLNNRKKGTLIMKGSLGNLGLKAEIAGFSRVQESCRAEIGHLLQTTCVLRKMSDAPAQRSQRSEDLKSQGLKS